MELQEKWQQHHSSIAPVQSCKDPLAWQSGVWQLGRWPASRSSTRLASLLPAASPLQLLLCLLPDMAWIFSRVAVISAATGLFLRLPLLLLLCCVAGVSSAVRP
jgi:hypothetical protein